MMARSNLISSGLNEPPCLAQLLDTSRLLVKRVRAIWAARRTCVNTLSSLERGVKYAADHSTDIESHNLLPP